MSKNKKTKKNTKAPLCLEYKFHKWNWHLHILCKFFQSHQLFFWIQSAISDLQYISTKSSSTHNLHLKFNKWSNWRTLFKFKEKYWFETTYLLFCEKTLPRSVMGAKMLLWQGCIHGSQELNGDFNDANSQGKKTRNIEEAWYKAGLNKFNICMHWFSCM